MKYVIVGNGAGGVGCITGIRKVDPEGEIKVVSYEPFCYSKPMIADILTGLPEEKLTYRDEAFFKANGVTLLSGRKAVKVDPGRKCVILEDGEEVPYDKLLLATGAVPFVPPIRGSDREGVFTFTELSSAVALKGYIASRGVQSVVVVGSGFIGLEVAYFLREAGVEKVTVVELLDRVLARALDERASKIVESIVREKGVNFLFRTTVESIEGNPSVTHVVLKDRTRLDAQVVVIAIGVRPRTELHKTAGAGVNAGAVTDDFMQTTVPDIYSAGDCVECLDVTDGRRKPIPLFPLAFEQGFVAGLNMAGRRVKYLGGLPLNSLKFLTLPVLNAGVVEPVDATCEVLVNDRFEKKGYYRKVVLKEGRLIGFVAVGEVDRVGILTNLIRQRMDVSAFKRRLIEPDFGLADLPPVWRRQKLLEDRTAYKDWGAFDEPLQ